MIWQFIDSSGVGGAERYVATVAGSLRARGVDVRVVLYQEHGENPWHTQLAAAGLPFKVLDGSFRGLVSALREDRPTIVHTHGYKAGVLGRLACLLTGIPSVTTFHSGARGPFPVGLYDWLDEYTALISHRIAVSAAVQQRLPFRSTLLVNYIVAPDRAFDRPLPREIGFVGRLSEEKRPDMFCALAQRVARGDASQLGHGGSGDLTVRETSWHVWGDGPMREELERQYGDVVTFHGAVADMKPVWGRLGLLVMPSRFEGLPFAGLESLAAGVPILASRVGGMPSLVRDGMTGWLFAVGDMDGAVAGFSRWSELDDKQSLQIRENCRNHLCATFSERNHVDGLLDVYRRAGLRLPASGTRDPVA